MSLPVDPDLGCSWTLTDPAQVARLLGLAGVAAGSGRIRYLEHDVGRSMLVHHRFAVAGLARDVVVSTGRRRWPTGSPARTDDRTSDAATDGAGDRTAAGSADGDDREAPRAELAALGVVRPDDEIDGVTVAWYPFDPGLPALAGGFRRYGLSGEIRRLAWVPQQRAVVADGDRVVKLEAEPARLAAGIRTLELLRDVVDVPAVLAVDPERGVFVQERLAGRPPEPGDALAWAGEAGRVAARIERSGLSDLPPLDRAALDAQVAPVLRLVVHAAPELVDRVARVAAAVERSTPAALAGAGPGAALRRPAHGDFNAGQFLARPDGRLGLVDTDTLCLAPPGYDLAAYATNLLAGRPGDLDACEAALAAVARGHGQPPDELPWLVAATALRRLDRPIRRYKSRWRPRLELLLTDVETLASRI